jgi:hypothetical protein
LLRKSERPHLKRLARVCTKQRDARGHARTGYFQCCFIYRTCHTYHVVLTVGQGLIFQTGSPDTSAPVRLLRERRESHARFVAFVSIHVDAARRYYEIFVRFTYDEITRDNVILLKRLTSDLLHEFLET